MSGQDHDDETPVAERTYLELRQAILKGEFASGERLVSSSLASRLGVSRTPVRAAILRLEADGLVETLDGRSARVRALTAADVEQAYDVAEGLEGVLVVRLASRASDEQVEQITEVAAEMEAAAVADDRHAWVEADERFHRLLAQIGQNPLLESMMTRVNNVIGRIRFLSLHLYPEGAKLSAQEHKSVADALRNRDGELARNVHQAHWARVRETNIVLLRESFATLGSIPSEPVQPGPAQG